MSPILDIIVPHYNEPFAVGKMLFDMLAMQKGVDFSKIRVLLIHDGSDFFPEETFSDYPYEVEQHRIAHKGVSAARNFGMDMATAKWVNFCDFDDYYSDVYALKLVMDTLSTEEHDLLWNPIWMEDYNSGEFRVYPLMKFNMIFIHNKYMRLDFLRKHNLRFNESLCYSEDSSFLAVMFVLLEQKRIGKISSPCPLFTWAYRIGSCTTDEKNKVRNINHLFEANRWICKRFEELEYEDTALMKFRTVCDAYGCLTGDDAPEDNALKERVKQFWLANKAEISKQNKSWMIKVFEASLRNANHGRKDVERPTLADWLKELENV